MEKDFVVTALVDSLRYGLLSMDKLVQAQDELEAENKFRKEYKGDITIHSILPEDEFKRQRGTRDIFKEHIVANIKMDMIGRRHFRSLFNDKYTFEDMIWMEMYDKDTLGPPSDSPTFTEEGFDTKEKCIQEFISVFYEDKEEEMSFFGDKRICNTDKKRKANSKKVTGIVIHFTY